MIRLAILGSTRGTNMLSLIQAIEGNRLEANIALVVSNKKEAPILERAKTYGVDAEWLSPEGLSRELYDQRISHLLQTYKIDLVVLIGYMRILSEAFVKQWEKKIINVHPSLLPLHAGLMDLQVHQAVLDAKETTTGCSVHFVTEVIDGGPVIVQKRCKVMEGDTAETLKNRVQALEGEALIEAINIVTTGSYIDTYLSEMKK